MTLNQQKVLLGITGSIAAYKTCELVRQLRQDGAQVQIVMTEAAKKFVSPMVLEALSGRPAREALFDRSAEMTMSHIELARWADLVLIAPASANCLARLAMGIADDLLSTICLATRAPVMIAPAMNTVMWEHPATQENVATLRRRGVTVLEPEIGEQACGEVGAGRMQEPEDLKEALLSLAVPQDLQGIQALVTAGPTRERIDPARFISNFSTGHMGCATADALLNRGAQVTLVCGPITLDPPEGAQVIHVTCADEMLQAVEQHGRECQLLIAAAAVADWRVRKSSADKIKKKDTPPTLALEPTADLLSAVATWDMRPYLVGFAAETEDLIENARAKLQAKGADLIVANLIGDNFGFGDVDSQLEVVSIDETHSIGPASKSMLARDLVEYIAARLGSPASIIDFNARAQHKNTSAG